jgi:hypothetical protein
MDLCSGKWVMQLLYWSFVSFLNWGACHFFSFKSLALKAQPSIITNSSLWLTKRNWGASMRVADEEKLGS